MRHLLLTLALFLPKCTIFPCWRKMHRSNIPPSCSFVAYLQPPCYSDCAVHGGLLQELWRLMPNDQLIAPVYVDPPCWWQLLGTVATVSVAGRPVIVYIYTSVNGPCDGLRRRPYVLWHELQSTFRPPISSVFGHAWAQFSNREIDFCLPREAHYDARHSCEVRTLWTLFLAWTFRSLNKIK